MGIMQMMMSGGLGEDVYWWNIANNTANIKGKAVAVDNNGNIYVAAAVTGYAKGQVSCFDKEGDILWTHKDDSQYFEDIAVDNLGYVYALTGSINDGTNGIGYNNSQPMLIKLNTSDGSEAQYDGGSEDGVDWRKMFHPTSTSSASNSTGLTVDSSGHPIVTLLAKGAGTEPVAIKFNKDTGAATWVTRLEDSSNGTFYMNEDGPGGVAVDSNDNVILCGWKTTSMGFTNSNYGTWVTKIAADGGSILYSRKLAATNATNQPQARAKCFTDSNDSVYITSNWVDDTSNELFTTVTKLDDDLEVDWSRIIVAAKADGTHIKNASNYTGPGGVDKNGNVFIAAWVSDCESANLGGSGDNCIFKLDSDGDNLEVVAIGDSNEDNAGGLVVNKLGNVVIAAQTKATNNMNILVAQLPGDMSITGNWSGHSTTVYMTKPSDESGLSSWTSTDIRTGSGKYLADGAYTVFTYDDYSSSMNYATSTFTPGTGEDPGAPITIS